LRAFLATLRSMSATESSTELAEVLGSACLARLALHFAVHADPPMHFRALQRHTGLGSRSLQSALERMVAWGVLDRIEKGRHVFFRLREDHPRWGALRSLVRSFADPAEVLREAMADVEGIEAAFVFGSTVRGDARPDSDVDLFVVGEDIPTVSLGRAVMSAQVLLDRPVDLKCYTPAKLAQRLRQDEGFVREAVEGPKRWVAGSPEALRSIAVA
jgi:predicted nucleotidyltransferase